MAFLDIGVSASEFDFELGGVAILQQRLRNVIFEKIYFFYRRFIQEFLDDAPYKMNHGSNVDIVAGEQS